MQWTRLRQSWKSLRGQSGQARRLSQPWVRKQVKSFSLCGTGYLSDADVPFGAGNAQRIAKRDIQSLKVVCSAEPVLQPKGKREAGSRRVAPGSISYVPSVAGLLLAGEVIRDLISWNEPAVFFQMKGWRKTQKTLISKNKWNWPKKGLQYDEKAFVTKEMIAEITKTYPTPFHIYDEKGIHENAKALKEAFAWNKGYKEFLRWRRLLIRF